MKNLRSFYSDSFAILISMSLSLFGYSQNPGWVIGDQVVEFQPGSNPVSSLLPTTADYSGQTAEFHQNTYYDDGGVLKFFIVDGNIYDADGYLIADSDSVSGCVQCLKSGGTEALIVPVPNSCSQFYIITDQASPSKNNTWYYPTFSVLDITLQNVHYPNDPTKLGAILHNGAGYLGHDWAAPANGAWSFPFPSITSRHGVEYNYPLSSSGPDYEYAHMDALLYPDSSSHLFIVANNLDCRMLWLEENTISTANVTGVGHIDWPTGFNGTATRRSKGEVELWGSDSIVRVAITDYFLDEDIPTHHQLGLFYAELIADYPNLTLQPGLPLYHELHDSNESDNAPNMNGASSDSARVSGLEFSPNGDFIFFLQDYSTDSLGDDGQLGVYDIAANTHIHLSAAMSNVVSSQLEINVSSVGTGKSLYMIGKDSLGSAIIREWIEPDLGPVSGPFNDFALTGQLAFNTGAATAGVYALMNAYSSDARSIYNTFDECCIEFFELNATDTIITAQGIQTWSPGNNPFGVYNGPIQINDLIHIPNGSTVVVDSMTIEFAPTGGVIVEPGGSMQLYNSKLTKWACTPERWKGVEVRGVNTLAQFPASNQGYLKVWDGSVIEHTWTATYVGERDINGVNIPTGAGGIIKMNQSSLLNNYQGVMMLPYIDDFSSPGFIFPNRSSFDRSVFLNDDDFIGPVNPNFQLWMNSVVGVVIDRCHFENSSSTLHPLFRGFGIQALGTATYHVKGLDTTTTFTDLYCGIFHGTLMWGSIVQDMDFVDNVYGIYDASSEYTDYYANEFYVPAPLVLPYVPVSIVLHQTEHYLVEQNRFVGNGQNFNVGVYFLGPQTGDEELYNNTFDSLLVGSAVYENHAVDSVTTGIHGLKKRCNEYFDNLVDWALLDSAQIHPAQGFIGQGIDEYANNRFHSAADCLANYDKYFDDPLALGHYEYNRINVAEHDPLCEFNLYYTDFMDPNIQSFDPDSACDDSRFNGQFIPNGTDLVGEYWNAHGAYESARANLEGTVDLNKKQDLIEAIHEQPWWASYALRDLLLGHSPLSDEVLLSLWTREQAMDQWHTLQVVLGNVPLDKPVWTRLTQSEILDAYHMALAEQAQNGTGPSVKDILEEELAWRGTLLNRVTNSRIDKYANDSLIVSQDSIIAILERVPGPTAQMSLLRHYIAIGDLSRAQSYLSTPVFNERWALTMRDVATLYLSVNGDLSQLSAAEIDALRTYASLDDYGSSWALAILVEVGEVNELPIPQLPDLNKSYDLGLSDKKSNYEIVVQMQPNPTDGIAYLTYPIEMEGYGLNVVDISGKQVFGTVLNAMGLLEFDCADLPTGLYLYGIERDGTRVASGKFEVKH